MSKALANELRARVLTASGGGMSRRRGSACLGVIGSSTIRGDDSRRREGDF
jgi:hypothetical protein